MSSIKYIKTFVNEKNVIALLIVGGIGLSLVQFLLNRSLWGDEAMLALNIIHRSPLELLKPLDYGQTAPPLFLLIEKLFSTIIPNSEYGLRLFPLLCFWASLYFFVRILKKQTTSKYVLITAISLFTASRLFCWYSSETKQYMTDAFVLLSIFWLTIKEYKSERMKYLALGIAGITAIFLSNTASIVLATCGLHLCYKIIKPSVVGDKKTRIWPLIFVFAAWLITAALYYCYFVHGHPLKDFMIQYYTVYNGFININPFDANFVAPFKNMLRTMFSAYIPLGEHLGNIVLYISFFVLAGLYVAGIVWMINRKKIGRLILYCLPLLLHLGLSVLQLYPVSNRFFIYIFPCMIIVWSLGFQYIIEKTGLIKYGWRALIPVCVLWSISMRPVKTDWSYFKDVMRYVENTSDKRMPINVYISDNPTLAVFKYYKDIGRINNRTYLLNDFDVEYLLSYGTVTQKPAYFTNMKLLVSREKYIRWLDEIRATNWANFTNKKLLISEEERIKWLITLNGNNWFLLDEHLKDSDLELQRINTLGYPKLDEYKTSIVSAYLYYCGE